MAKSLLDGVKHMLALLDDEELRQLAGWIDDELEEAEEIEDEEEVDEDEEDEEDEDEEEDE